MNSLSPEIRARIKAIINESDINTISAKRIRKQLLSEFEITLDKHVIDEEIIAIYKQCVDVAKIKHEVKHEVKEDPQTDSKTTVPDREIASSAKVKVESEIDTPIRTQIPGRTLEVDLDNIIPTKRRSGKTSTPAPVKKKKKSVAKVDLITPSEELAKIIGVEGEIQRFDVYMKIWEYAKTNSLIDPNDDRQINCDAALESLVNSKTITIATIEDLLNPALGGTTGTAPKSKFNKEMDISSDLQEITGVSRMSRPGVVKLLWRYIKLMGFQRGKTILNDARLEKVFGKKKMDMFAMNKLLGKHLYEIEQDGEEEVDDEEELIDESESDS